MYCVTHLEELRVIYEQERRKKTSPMVYKTDM